MRIAVFVVLVLCGCQDSRWFRTAKSYINKPVAVPNMKEPSLAAAARVDQVGRQILAANIFCGVDTSFQTIGNDEPLLFHRGYESIFISDALVNRCTTDEELAVVLCHELGQMISEKRNAARMGYSEPMINITQTNNGEMGGITGDQFRLAELAAIEKRTPKKVVDRVLSETTDPRKIARDLYKTTGLDESKYASGEVHLRGLNKQHEVIQQLEGGAQKPEWMN